MLFRNDTIAAIATPPGEGGIALVRVSGPDARALAARLFRSPSGANPAAFPGYSVHYGLFVDPATSEVADDGLLTTFRAPRSYTGEDTVELACHGGRVTTARVLRLTLDAGARLAEPGEFTLRAFLNGRLDLAQAEAVADMVRARTEAARRVARQQLAGALSRAVAALKDELVGILAAIEVTIDFSDEVGELEYPPLEARLQAVRAGLERLLATAEQGRILREGLRVAIVGRPNVGKSSLLNALLRADRAIVTPIAGTTRDLLEESANVQGVPLVLVDTAGLRDTADVVERIGVERAEEAAAAADVVLLVLDASVGVTPEDVAIGHRLTALETHRARIVVNKVDLVSAAQAHAVVAAARQVLPASVGEALLLSAQTGVGLEGLEAALVEGIAAPATKSRQNPYPEAAEESETVIVAAARHRQALEAAVAAVREAERTTQACLPGDFIALDVRGALDALGQITGETVTEEIIHRIFHDFCVGK